MNQPHIFWGYLPFWLWTYGLAVIAWTCVGRFLLGFIVPADSPNYIWRWFRRLTDWWLRMVAVVTPRYIEPRYLPLVGMYWAFLLRFAGWPLFNLVGMAPTLTPPA
jgi:YggT family protein